MAAQHSPSCIILMHSLVDNQAFPISRDHLQKSEFFRDMFDCCNSTPECQIDLVESASTLQLLIRLLESPPALPVRIEAQPPEQPFSVDSQELYLPKYDYFKKRYDPSTVLPYPILPEMLTLSDKYILPTGTMEILGEHLVAHAPTYALQVYGLAALYGLTSAANEASQFLQPIESYSTEEVAVIPTVRAYHAIVQMQAYRVAEIRRILLGEELFPHGYGTCSYHVEEVLPRWDTKRQLLACHVDSLTDAAGEMACLLDESEIKCCDACSKAIKAAVEMIGYKCRRIPRKLDQVVTGR